MWQCGSEGRKTGWSRAWKKNQHLFSYHWKQQIRKALPFDTQCFCLTSSTKDQSLRPTKGLTKDRTVGPCTSCHTGTPQIVLLLCLVASYLFLQMCQPGIPAEESRKQKAREKKKKQNPWPLSLSKSICLKDIWSPCAWYDQKIPPFCSSEERDMRVEEKYQIFFARNATFTQWHIYLFSDYLFIWVCDSCKVVSRVICVNVISKEKGRTH